MMEIGDADECLKKNKKNDALVHKLKAQREAENGMREREKKKRVESESSST